jgi:hypothetical protein
MSIELLTLLARSRHERLLREASQRRALRANRRTRVAPRLVLARALRAMGYVVLSLGDAVADSR